MKFSKAELKNFNKAKTASTFSTFAKHHLGAVIMYGNSVLSVGWNSNKESPLQKKYNRLRDFDVDRFPNYGHAEIYAIHKLENMVDCSRLDRSKLSIYVWRGKNDTKMMARPCPACMAALRDFGIKNIYYTGDNSFVFEELD